MALYTAEEEMWKCPKHPSKRRPNGVCPTCLRDRLSVLCPHCANLRPCGCSSTATSSSSSSSSSSFSLFSSFSSSSRTTAPESAVGRVGSLIEIEPKFQRSKSVAIPFTKSRLSSNLVSDHKPKAVSFWSIFKRSKNRKGQTETRNYGYGEAKDYVIDNLDERDNNIVDLERMMLKSRSMRAQKGECDVKGSSSKGKSWYFPSPIKLFRQRSKVVQERSPLQR